MKSLSMRSLKIIARTAAKRMVVASVMGVGMLSLAGCVIEPAPGPYYYHPGHYYSYPPYPRAYYGPGPGGGPGLHEGYGR